MRGQGNLSVCTVVHKSEGNALVSRLYRNGEPQHILVEMDFDILRGARFGPGKNTSHDWWRSSTSLKTRTILAVTSCWNGIGSEKVLPSVVFT